MKIKKQDKSWLQVLSGDVGAGLTFGVSDSNIFGSGNNLNTNFNLNNENAQFEISLIQYPLASSKIQNSYSLFNTEKDLKKFWF